MNQRTAGPSQIIGWHVTTKRKLSRYKATGCIYPPVRFWDILLKVWVPESLPIPNHGNARYTPSIVRRWEVVET